MYIFNGAYSIFYLMHHKILTNMGFGFVRVKIKGTRISEGLLYWKVTWEWYSFYLKTEFHFSFSRSGERKSLPP